MNYAEWPLSAPVNITWEITHLCNLRCIHCLSASGSESKGELSFKQCLSIVDQLAEMHIFEINFGGGEPFLKEYFMDLLEYIHSKNIMTCISTNGTLLTDKVAKSLSNDPLVQVQVSLDGASSVTNDYIRGEGTFDLILQGIKILSRHNISFSVNTVVTALNYPELNLIKSLASSYGARLRVSRFRPSGRAKKTWETLKLDAKQLEGLSDWLGEHPQILTGDSFFSVTGKERKEMGLDMCGACKMTSCIDPCGNIFPCAFLQEPVFNAGNLRETAFQDIWDNSPVFKSFRELAPATCINCSRYEVCRGGCPAVAYFVQKDINSPDPECLASWNRASGKQ